ncbi:MAG TPA: O-antigen ligase family protein [Solirubrobacteraceae bacterium]|jgi:O-antigen ligase|nr:O-antigen ligase family protein [Solirubrobacteraceae bacterium]
MILAAAGLGRVAEHLGVIAAALLAGFAVLGAGRRELDRARALAIGLALAATPILLVAAIWGSPQLRSLRHHPLVGLAAILAALAAVGVLAVVISRRPWALPLLAVAALPFRVPISSGGDTSNLLIPLYAVVAAGTVVLIARVLRGSPVDSDEPAAGMLEWALVGSVLLYAVQATYSQDFTKALEQIVFFYIPFALLFVLLRRIDWSGRLLVTCLGVLVGLALVFAFVGFGEYASRGLLLNPKVISSNMVESYFRVNSLFYDPNIYGRFLAVVMLLLSTAMLWGRTRRDVLAAAACLTVLWGALMTSISQSSIAALVLGLGVLAALRWNPRRTAAIGVALVLAGGVFVVLDGSSVRVDLSSSRGADQATTGRFDLVKGGVDLFAQRPLQGYGAGSFAVAYRAHEGSSSDAESASHTIPITVAAEQGLIGLAVYLVLLSAAFARLFGGGVRSSPARVALATAFAALVVHTMAYADFLEDPITWTLLGIGAALAAAATRDPVVAPSLRDPGGVASRAGPGGVGEPGGATPLVA